MQGLVEGGVLHHERTIGPFVNPPGDGVSVRGPFLQGAEDQQADRALQQREGVLAHCPQLDGGGLPDVPLII